LQAGLHGQSGGGRGAPRLLSVTAAGRALLYGDAATHPRGERFGTDKTHRRAFQDQPPFLAMGGETAVQSHLRLVRTVHGSFARRNVEVHTPAGAAAATSAIASLVQFNRLLETREACRGFGSEGASTGLDCFARFMEGTAATAGVGTWVSWRLVDQVTARVDAAHNPLGAWVGATARRVSQRLLASGVSIPGHSLDHLDSAGPSTNRRGPFKLTAGPCPAAPAAAAFAALQSQFGPCFALVATQADTDTLDCTADLGQAFRQHPDLTVVLDCILLVPHAVPSVLSRAVQLRVLRVGLTFAGSSAVTAYFDNAATVRQHRSPAVLEVLETLTALHRPSAPAVNAVCRLLPLFVADAGHGAPHPELGQDDAAAQALLTASMLLGRLAEGLLRQPVDGSTVAMADIGTVEDVVRTCGSHLGAFLDLVGAREAFLVSTRANITRAAVAEWGALHPRRQVKELFMGAPLAGMPHYPRLLQEPQARAVVTAKVVQGRVSRAVEALHATDAVAVHHLGLELVLLAAGNAALPQFLDVIERHSAHPEYSVRFAAVRALGRYPGTTAAHALARLLSPPPTFQALFQEPLDVDLKRHVLAVVTEQHAPHNHVLQTVHGHLEGFYDIHGEDPLGCVGRCDVQCTTGVPLEEPSAVTQPCVDHCRRLCAEVVEYHASVLDLLHVHHTRLQEHQVIVWVCLCTPHSLQTIRCLPTSTNFACLHAAA
jgi:hypothetical protein